MRILHVIDHWGLGGAQRALSVLLDIETLHEHHVTALFSHHRSDWPLPNDRQPRFLARTYSGIPFLIPRLRSEIRRVRPDLIHVHLTGSRFMTFGALRGSHSPPGVLWHEHSGDEYAKRYGKIVGGTVIGLQRCMAGSVDLVVANSDASKSFCHRRLGFPLDRIAVIGCTVDSVGIRSASASDPTYRLDHSATTKPIMGFIGRLAKQKRPFDFLHATDALISEGTASSVWIIGDGPLRRPMERWVARRGDKHRFVFWGEREDVYALMRCLDVVLMPSAFEPFGLVAAESIAMNTPVVGYDVEGLSDVLRTNALGVPVTPGNVDQLIEKARQAILNPPQSHWRDGKGGFMDVQSAAEMWNRVYGNAVGAHHGDPS